MPRASVPARRDFGVGIEGTQSTRLVIALGLFFVSGMLAPLADADLPMHLAVGEWIIKHGAVPHLEPFAWTRTGAPYFAYSWLADTAFFALLAHGGVLALRGLNGLAFAGAFGAMYIAARSVRVSREAAFLIGTLNFFVLISMSAFLRPQAFLLTLVPLAWAAMSSAIERPNSRSPIVVLFVLAALAANTHILFPLVGVPLVLCALRDTSRHRSIALAATVVAGMLMSPYALEWVSVFRLNFSPNALFGPRTTIAEYQPGFVRDLPLGLLLASFPLFVRGAFSSSERNVYGPLWLIGLLAFALRVKGLMVWWLISLPMAIEFSQFALARAPRSWRHFPILLTVSLAIATAARFILGGSITTPSLVDAWRAEHRIPQRSLSGPAAIATEPLIARLADLDVRVRLLTVFDFGSYVPWRAPLVSESVDGRTIFPDSAALPDAAVLPNDLARPLGPWRSADAAMVPMSYPVAAVLDSSKAWIHVASTVIRSPFGPIGLWVRRDWYSTVCASKCPMRIGAP